MKTYSAKPADISRKWYVIDAGQAPLGRLATQVATLLTGKGKPVFTHHIDCGDYVVIINSDNLVVSGNKMTGKTYYRHSNYPGGLKQANLQAMMDRDSTQVIIQAVRGMLPVNKLRDGRLARLKVYPGPEHNHSAQNPETHDVRSGK